MNWLAPLVIFLAWIGVWGLSDLLVEGWTREQKAKLYGAMLAVVAIILYAMPHVLDRF